MQYNLLKMVQLILSAMDSDEVNSIDDTTEATQVVDVIETVYYDLASTIDFPDHWDFFELEATGASTPTVMNLPSDVVKLEWVEIDWAESGSTKRDLRSVMPMDRTAFFRRMNGLDSADANVFSFDYTVDTGTFGIFGKNDSMPVYYTSANDRTLIFESYDTSLGSFLTGNRTWCYGMRVPEFTRSNAFVPDFPPRHFSLFFNEAKSQAFAELKQIENAKAEQRARKGWVQAGRKMPQVPGQTIKEDFMPNYGRRGKR